jgi:hypothetical protein
MHFLILPNVAKGPINFGLKTQKEQRGKTAGQEQSEADFVTDLSKKY